jgi:hypothetical protein
VFKVYNLPPPRENPPKPRFVLRVGVTGHCSDRLSAVELQRVAVSAADIIQRLGTVAVALKEGAADAFDSAQPTLRFVSSLADGVDQIVSEVALREGHEVQACLPFSGADYRADFPSDDWRKVFDEIRKSPRCTAVLVLDGGRGDLASASYQAASRVVVQQSDLVVAVWNGERSRGPGGTRDAMADALNAGIPVVWVPTGGGLISSWRNQRIWRVIWRD